MTWIASDLHFGHKNIVRFKKPNGEYVRPGFVREDGVNVRFNEDIGVHDASLIHRWNQRVGSRDTVYILGDFGHPLRLAESLNGRKTLILGNHDDKHNVNDFGKYFVDVLSWKVFRDSFAMPVVLCHYPLHAQVDDPTPRKLCVHGHIHEKLIRQTDGTPDPWYINVCVEHTNHAPMAWEELESIVNERKRIIGDIPHDGTLTRL